MFGLVGSSTCLRRRATHGKSAGRTPDHIHRHGGVQVHGMIARHGNGAGGCGGVTCSILYGVSQNIISRAVHIHRSRDHDLIGDISVTGIVGLNAGLRPGLARLARDGGSPEQFQFGIRHVRLDCLETNTEANMSVTIARGADEALS